MQHVPLALAAVNSVLDNSGDIFGGVGLGDVLGLAEARDHGALNLGVRTGRWVKVTCFSWPDRSSCCEQRGIMEQQGRVGGGGAVVRVAVRSAAAGYRGASHQAVSVSEHEG